ncbi:hypothetical protein DL771_006376 [Monosporascus sp. 5C6A]|nr:hypothetical protein DL771_006376 [Monosporascus sp. 5C6A]
MGLSKLFRRSKNSNDVERSHGGGSQPAQTLVPYDDASSFVAGASSGSASLADQRPSRPDSDPPQATEPPPSATANRTSIPNAHPASPPSQTALPQSKAAPSLWGRAYEALRDEYPQLMDEYERLLSKELPEHVAAAASQDVRDQNEDSDHIENRINTDPDTRRDQLKKIIDQGLQRASEKKTRYTIFGYESVPRDQVAHAAQFIQAMKGLVNEAVRASPEASVAWAGVCVLLPVLTNPSAAEEANRDGLSYVTSRICYYVELERLLWPVNAIRLKPVILTGNCVTPAVPTGLSDIVRDGIQKKAASTHRQLSAGVPDSSDPLIRTTPDAPETASRRGKLIVGLPPYLMIPD